MQIRLDHDIAKTVKRNADAHRRIFKRYKSCAAIVNEALRDLFGKRTEPQINIVVPRHD